MTSRERVIRWEDPAPGLAAMPTLSGLDYLTAIRDGQLPAPPISAPMLLELIEVADGQVVFTCTPDESLYNPIGSVHGGTLCTLLDSVTGCAGHSTLPAGTGYTSVDINVRFLRPVTLDTGTLTATGTVIKRGRRILFTEAIVTDPHGRVVATATSTLLVMPLTANNP